MSLPHLSIFQESSRPCHLRSLFRHSHSPHCHPLENGGPGQQTRFCKGKGRDTRYVSHGTLVPRLRGDDKKGGIFFQKLSGGIAR